MEEHPSESMLDGAEGRRGAKLMKSVPHGKPYAGKLHVRFDEDILRAEGESRSDALAEVRAFPMGRPALLYTLQFR